MRLNHQLSSDANPFLFFKYREAHTVLVTIGY